MSLPPTWSAIERMTADHRAAFDDSQALHRALSSGITGMTASEKPGTQTAAALDAARDTLRRTESLLKIWDSSLARVEQLLQNRSRAGNLAHAVSLLDGQALILDPAALRKEDRRPPGAPLETRFSLGYVRESAQTELGLIRRTLERITANRKEADRLEILSRAVGASEGSASTRTAVLVELAATDPLRLRQAELVELKAELLTARHAQVRRLIDELEVAENEAPSIPRASRGLSKRLSAVDTPSEHFTLARLGAIQDDLAAITSRLASALSQIRAAKKTDGRVRCTRRECTGAGVIEEDGTCSVCFLPPERGAA